MLMPHSLVPQSPAELDTGGSLIRNGEPKTTLTGPTTPQPASLSAATPTPHLGRFQDHYHLWPPFL